MAVDTIDTANALRPSEGVAAATAMNPTAHRHVALRLDPARLRRVHHELARRLGAEPGVRVAVIKGEAQQPVPPSLELLFSMERLVHRVVGPRLADRIEWRELNAPERPPAATSDLTVDLCSSATVARRGCSVRVLYDGMPDEACLVGALLAGRMPVIEIEDGPTGTILARALPCADNAGTILDAMDCVLARVITLVMAIARGHGSLSPAGRPAARTPRLKDMARFEAKSLAHAIVHRGYKLCFHTPHWRTCWRFVDDLGVWDTRSLHGTTWNVLPDPGFRFYADPFPFVHEGRTFLFLEDLDHRTNKAVISVVPFDKYGPSGPAEPVLEEPWHLSYPHVFAHDGQVWMIPESSANRTVTLYRAEAFPHRWVKEAELLTGIQASDATVIQHDGRFWMFAATRDDAGSWSDTLSIFSAPQLRGPWQPHAGNPILIDQASARPAGAMVARDGKLWRPVQDCAAGYGTGIGLAEITRLTPDSFEQKVRTVLRAQPEWPGRRLHTLNRAGHLECIDGSAYSPRSRFLARRLQTWSGRRDIVAR
jgi:hypothetical protein